MVLPTTDERGYNGLIMSEESQGKIEIKRALHLPGVIIEQTGGDEETQIGAVPGADLVTLEGDDGSEVTVGLPAELHDIIGQMLKKEGYTPNE
jgi:hypothetical protein